jgi:hypothetical protein
MKPAVKDAEQWSPIPGYEALYACTSHGRIWSHRKSRFLRQTGAGGKHGQYLSVRLYAADGSDHYWTVHKLVLLTFRGPCPPGEESRHLDDNPKNNRLSNLVYGTHGQNEQDKTRNGGRPVVTHCVNGHEYTEANTTVTSQGKKCRTCHNESRRARYQSKLTRACEVCGGPISTDNEIGVCSRTAKCWREGNRRYVARTRARAVA